MSVVGGYLVLRYFYDDVVYQPERMIAQISEVLRRGRGWRP
jgi:very-short-patch-repair endonuclease